MQKKKKLYAEVVQLEEKNKSDLPEITGYMEHWDELSISDKITVVDCVIEQIIASEDKLEITWKI